MVIYKCGTYRRSWICRPCHNARVHSGPGKAAYNRTWLAANPEKAADYSRRARFRRHGLTEEEYVSMWREQGEACAICRRADSSRWAIDHDHDCCAGLYGCGGCVRGILCIECNTGLGMFRDNPELLRAAAAFLSARHLRPA